MHVLLVRRAARVLALTGPCPACCARAQWCSVCKKLKPELERAAELLAETDLEVVVGRADVNADEVLRDRFDVQRTPKFMVFTNGEPEPFLTYKSGEAMFSKLHSDLRPESGVQHSPAKMFTDMSELASWLFWRGTDGGRLEAAAVLFLPSEDTLQASPGAAATTQALRESFTTVAIDMVTKMRYAEVRNDEVLKLFEMPQDRATVAMYTEHDEGKHLYDGPAGDVRRLRAFLLERLSPMVTDVDHVSLNKVSRATPLLMHLFVSEEEMENPALHRAVVNQVRCVCALALPRIVRHNTPRLCVRALHSGWVRPGSWRSTYWRTACSRAASSPSASRMARNTSSGFAPSACPSRWLSPSSPSITSQPPSCTWDHRGHSMPCQMRRDHEATIRRSSSLGSSICRPQHTSSTAPPWVWSLR